MMRPDRYAKAYARMRDDDDKHVDIDSVDAATFGQYALIDARELNDTLHLLNEAIRKRDRCALWPVTCIGLVAMSCVVLITSSIMYRFYTTLSG